jgi:hypothetical protein
MAGALGLLASCVDEEGVLLSAKLESPAVTVNASSLVTEVTGDFEIHLLLGDRASDSTTVELGTFSLQRNGDVLLNPLEIATSPEFPVTVGVGGSKDVHVTIDHPEAEAELGDELCGGPLEIVGTLTDSLGDDRPVTLSSGPVQPTCPLAP